MTPAHVSSRYHQSLRNQLICEGTVVPTNGGRYHQLICEGTFVPTNGAKLMVLFLSILDWNLLESLGRSLDRIDIQPAQKGWSGGRCVGRLSDA